MPGRNVRQCIDRWKRNNSPKNPRREWTTDEDNILLEKYNQFGKNYATLAKFIPFRNELSVKNRLEQLLTTNKQPKIEVIATMQPKPETFEPKKVNESDITLDRILNQVGLDAFSETFDLSLWNQSSDLFKL
ncbi:Myb-like DNA-binding domain containing protein [Trichomonas vaginalis G3]|uniref:Myb-like DNA-binding domain containing protein n=1 Tax=Trichomonas vaginalis (strain ATCC PRA-98 / G3) TaxID=412133 RepID=A2FN73_TRIV3|nr:RNA polymerase II transcription regulator recruiting protein [Trichomonas vaginalis G3]EAX93632.1 Myb-like DNA-binding domain containing protein [Trichomonas vaginalis G3]KAI5507100.1 RNA polymerase II transcription regulator recruiting protein [Trichomonas vaginalis G3]|eukprot:XP_001306562.1 Myb-like DNA-binding domain containing protein [Trichomonas vaginalis G3]